MRFRVASARVLVERLVVPQTQHRNPDQRCSGLRNFGMKRQRQHVGVVFPQIDALGEGLFVEGLLCQLATIITAAIAYRAINRGTKFLQLVFTEQVRHHHESVAAEVLDQDRTNNLFLDHPICPVHFYYAIYGTKCIHYHTPAQLKRRSLCKKSAAWTLSPTGKCAAHISSRLSPTSFRASNLSRDSRGYGGGPMKRANPANKPISGFSSRWWTRSGAPAR